MKISIALATYNGAAYLDEQLASFLTQTRRPDELVVSDDGSSDATVDLIRSFGATAPFPVTLMTDQTRLGYGGNFFRAVAQTTGDIVVFSDQDDAWSPAKLLRIEAAFAVSRPPVLVVHDARIVGANLTPTGAGTIFAREGVQIGVPGPLDRRFLGVCMAADGSFARRGASVFMGVGAGVDTAHDSLLSVLWPAVGRLEVLSDVLVDYRQHAGNAFGAKPLGVGHRIGVALNLDRERVLVRVRLAEQRAALLERLAADDVEAVWPNARMVARRWLDYATVLRARSDLYDSGTCFGPRVASLAFLHRNHAYRTGSDVALGAAAGIKDGLVCLAGSSRLSAITGGPLAPEGDA